MLSTAFLSGSAVLALNFAVRLAFILLRSALTLFTNRSAGTQGGEEGGGEERTEQPTAAGETGLSG